MHAATLASYPRPPAHMGAPHRGDTRPSAAFVSKPLTPPNLRADMLADAARSRWPCHPASTAFRAVVAEREQRAVAPRGRGMGCLVWVAPFFYFAARVGGQYSPPGVCGHVGSGPGSNGARGGAQGRRTHRTAGGGSFEGVAEPGAPAH